jgi:hypothetical protein
MSARQSDAGIEKVFSPRGESAVDRSGRLTYPPAHTTHERPRSKRTRHGRQRQFALRDKLTGALLNHAAVADSFACKKQSSAQSNAKEPRGRVVELEAMLPEAATFAAVSAARKLARRWRHTPRRSARPDTPRRASARRKRHCVQSLPERYRVLCPPGTWAFLGAFLCADDEPRRHKGTKKYARVKCQTRQATVEEDPFLQL